MNDVPLDGMFAALRQSRRAALVTLAAAGVSLMGVPALDARKKHGRTRKRRRQNVKKNAFGCVNAGAFCRRASQCCSGICSGKKGKKRCRGHDASSCQLHQDICFDETATCTTTAGLPGECLVTTGRASFCGAIGFCTDCSRDADCVPLYGPGAACIVCVPGCGDHTPHGTSCVVPGGLVK